MARWIGEIGGGLVGLTGAYLVFTALLALIRRPVRDDGIGIERYIFLVPALNEERVIMNTVESLAALPPERVTVIVIDDGSTDKTAELAESAGLRNLAVLRRRLPDAQKGKGAALNAGYAAARQAAQRTGLDPRRVVVAVVDADGRIPSHTLSVADRFFGDSRVGALQLQVRIRNRKTILGRCQDYEFLLFSSLTQAARENLGSVGLGGNGQFVRLAALDGLGDEPWTACLTEDLDLGVRLAINGWDNRFTAEVAVEQQGVDSVKRLVRQRTRWMQGHFQCYRLIPSILRSKMPTLAALDLTYYLIAPAFALAGPIVFVAPLVFVAFKAVQDPGFYLTGGGAVYLAVLYFASFAPLYLLGLLYRRRSRDISLLGTIGLVHLLAVYSWVWYVAEWRAVARILLRRGGWAKTERVDEAVALHSVA